MEVKFLGENIEIDTDKLEEKTINGIVSALKSKSTKYSKEDGGKIIVFANGKKVEDFSITLEDCKIDESSKIYVLVKNMAESKSDSKSKGSSEKVSTENPHSNPGQQFTGIPDMQSDMIANLMKNPEALESTLRMVYPNMSPEQMQMCLQSLSSLAQNPEMMKSLMQNFPGMGGINPAMMENVMNGMRPPNGMNSPNMMNGMGVPNGMNSPNMMYNPMMYNPMMNGGYGMPYYGNSPYMNNQMMNNKVAPPANGPCEHGFYPLTYVDGKPTGKNAELVYATQLRSLEEMGFRDRKDNIEALIKAKGDIDKALDELSKNK